MNKRLIYSLYIGFVSIGMVSSIVGPMVARIREEIGMSLGQAGMILSGQNIGMLISVFVGGFLADKYGKKPFLTAGSVMLIIGLAGAMLSGNFPVLFACTITYGLGFGAYEVGINSICSDLNTGNKGKALNFLHFFYSIGAIIGPVVVTLCVHLLNNWRPVYGIASMFPLVVFILIFPITLEKRKEEGSQGFMPFKNGLIWMSGILIMIYVGIEISAQGWISTYWEYIAPNSFIPASIIPAAFWISLAVGRLFSGGMADKIGLSRYLTLAAIACMAVSFLWIYTKKPEGIFIIIILIGILLSGIFPTLTASAISLNPGMSGGITAFIMIFSSIGGFVIPSGVGSIADLVGLGKLPVITFILAVIMFAVSAVREAAIQRNKVRHGLEGNL